MSTRMLVDPELLPLIDAFPPLDITDETLAEVRRTLSGLALPIEAYERPDISISRHQVPGCTGDPDVSFILYRPSNVGRASPALLHVHGGGYVSGSAELMGPWCVQTAAELGCVVASVDYRLAPETTAPGAVRDCYAVLSWLNNRADRLNIDPRRVAIAGESAGGGLAAATAIYARDRGEFALCHQSLMYPMLDDRAVVRPSDPDIGLFIWNRSNNSYGWSAYLGVAPGSANVSPYAAPGREPDLSRLPPAYIAVGALDLFLGENVEYARRLSQAGVPTEFRVFPGAVHGFDLSETASCAKTAIQERKRYLSEALKQKIEPSEGAG